ncbi:MAG: hypothetical protein ABSH38_15635 [Verrucomicrobiota bacterium]|jgi:hypothetical protein
MKSTFQAEQQMITTILNYPGFQTLPKGVKRMLLVTEAHFFDQPAPHHQEQKGVAQEMRSNRGLEELLRSPLIPVGIAWDVPA